MLRYLVASCGLMAGRVLGTAKPDPDLFKVVLVGDKGVGKKTLQNDLTDGDRPFDRCGVDFQWKTVKIDGKTVQLMIWNTVGQERFRSITSAYYRGSDAIILVYDVTKQDSFDHINDWLRDFNQYSTKETCKLLVGTRCDKVEEKKVSFDDAKIFADNLNIPLLETSNKHADDKEKALFTLAGKLMAIRHEPEKKRQQEKKRERERRELEEYESQLQTKSTNETGFGGILTFLGGRRQKFPCNICRKLLQGPRFVHHGCAYKGSQHLLPEAGRFFACKDCGEFIAGIPGQGRVPFDTVRAKKGLSANESMGMNMDKNLTILSIHKDGWAEKNTDLKKYISHRLVKFNTAKVKTIPELQKAIKNFAGQDVVLHLVQGDFKAGDFVHVKNLDCTVVGKKSDSEFLVEWTGPKDHFKEIGMDADDCEEYGKVKTKDGHIRSTFVVTNDDIFKEMAEWETWERNVDGVMSVGGAISSLPAQVSSMSSSPVSPDDYLITYQGDYIGMIGHCIIEKELGRGAFGCVYLGHVKDEGPDEKYAIKELRNMNPRNLKYAEQEAGMMQKLEHENVAKCFESFFVDNGFYLLLSYCNAGDLNDQIKNQMQKNKQWKNVDITECFHQVVSGLHCLHSHRSEDFPGGILHRDLKPGNILVSKSAEGVVVFKITDFGLARKLDDSHASARTTAGTEVYMAPEVLDDDTTYSFPNDIWALGCILYELCILERAFKKKKSVWAMVNLEGEQLQSAIPKISKDTADDWTYRKNLSILCSDLLVKDVSQRPTCADLLERVKELKDFPDDQEKFAGTYDPMIVVVKE